jgi:hypothetical protein
VVGGPIALLPWLREQLGGDGTAPALAFSEWNYGGGDHVSGALATADVLGVFGRERVGLATLWLLRSPAQERFLLAGLRVFTNYDGAGARFGGTSVAAATSDVARVTAYASDDDFGGRQVIVLINKDPGPVTVGLTVAAPRTLDRLDRWDLTAAGATITAGAALTPVATNAFRVELPGSSIAILAR